MICKNIVTNIKFNYEFSDNNDFVIVFNPYIENSYHRIPYDEWCKTYLVLDKWNFI